LEHRTCQRAFNCRECQDYPQFAALPTNAPEYTFGLDYPPDRYYHRGHSWARKDADGLVSVGLDDLAARLVGKPDNVILPAKGAWLEANGTAWRMRKNGAEIRVLSPVDGEVVESGGAGEGYYLKLRVPKELENWRHLLRGAEVPGWLMRELERLQIQLAPGATGPSLADGGMLVNGLMDQMPKADWDKVLGGTFLEG
jgi:glycine cleavage system H lipoate-binding protein